VAEDAGGHGASWREVAVVAEELGRALTPTPFLGSTVLATAALQRAGAADLLRELAEGRSTATLAIGLDTAPGTPFPVAVRHEAGESALSGTVANVVDAAGADVVIVPAMGPDGPALFAVRAGDLTQQRVVALDLTRTLSDLTLDAAPGELLASGEQAEAALEAALVAGAVVLASEQLGLAERCLELTVAYLKERYQFGRPLGSFQALKHRLADIWAEVTQARAVTRYAADCLATGDADLPVAAALAQAYCGPVAVHAAEECVQLHGGIGFTWEHPAHLYLKRAKSSAIAFGTADQHRAALAPLVDLQPV